MTVEGMNLAEKYQCPVILLSDGSLAFSTQTIPAPKPGSFEIVKRKLWDGKGEFKRYELTEDHISPMADPGTPGAQHIATGLEHNESGTPRYGGADRVKQINKRFSKLDTVEATCKPTEVDGDGDADVGIIAWGSTIGVIREAVDRMRADGLKVKGFYPKLMWPMPVDQYEAFAKTCKTILVPEVNHQGQLAHFIRSETTIKPVSYPISEGLPFTPAMIVDRTKELI
jgi:2-oxoglutarate/2-oxoacid ferredoxin oxidoreductase subunit alpha